MSVENFAQLGGAVDFLVDISEHCFYCNRPLAGIVAYWHGQPRGIALHPDCSIKLGAHLCRDGINARLVTEGKNAGVGVSIVAAK